MPSEITLVFRILMSSNNQQTNCLVIFCSTLIANKHEICSVWLVLLMYGPYNVLINRSLHAECNRLMNVSEIAGDFPYMKEK